MIYLLTCFSLLAAASPAQNAMKKQSTQQGEPTPAQIAMKKHNQMLNRMPFREYGMLSEVLSAGLIIVLQDQSKWEVEKVDTLYTSAWLGPVRIRMERISNPDEYVFPFEMTNLATRTTVHAKRIQ